MSAQVKAGVWAGLIGGLVVIIFGGWSVMVIGVIMGVALGLTLGGPAAALAVMAARAWWPRLTGLIAVGAVASLVLTARAVIP